MHGARVVNPQLKYPAGTSQISDAVTEEVEPQGSGSHQEETEVQWNISPMSHGNRRLQAEEENGGTTASGDRGTRDKSGKIEIQGEENQRRRRAVRKNPATKEGEDAQRPATFREERGQFRYELLRNGA
ncbi:hypothetical protein NDU88_002873 [Pleurodeles waltl]|uniref:Uncharacterized protein n=1 Tax=Pleurodeles waltl TaxID=8319 RepID=A0AAV7L2H6_PLEWA|nr:hypothetical protein NDU88_002873 [Pleurodeles waltl]